MGAGMAYARKVGTDSYVYYLKGKAPKPLAKCEQYLD
jgi:hypothetical protein